jgi:hypothetical protein
VVMAGQDPYAVDAQIKGQVPDHHFSGRRLCCRARRGTISVTRSVEKAKAATKDTCVKVRISAAADGG